LERKETLYYPLDIIAKDEDVQSMPSARAYWTHLVGHFFAFFQRKKLSGTNGQSDQLKFYWQEPFWKYSSWSYIQMFKHLILILLMVTANQNFEAVGMKQLAEYISFVSKCSGDTDPMCCKRII
jgi:hypothetical protein